MTFTVLLRQTNLEVSAETPRLAVERIAGLHPDLRTAVESVARGGTDDFEDVRPCCNCGGFIVGNGPCHCRVLDHLTFGGGIERDGRLGPR